MGNTVGTGHTFFTVWANPVLAERTNGELFVFAADAGGSDKKLNLFSSADEGRFWNDLNFTTLAGITENETISATSILVDSNDRIHLLWIDQNTSQLKYANSYTGLATTAVITSSTTALGMTATIDSSDNMHVLVPQSSRISYFIGVPNYPSVGWNEAIVATEAGDPYTMGIGAEDVNNVHCVWVNNGSPDLLKTRSKVTGVWGAETIIATNTGADLFSNGRLQLDPGTDNIYFIYNDSDDIKVATNQSGSWTDVTIVSGVSSIGDGVGLNIAEDNSLYQFYYGDSGSVYYINSANADLSSMSSATEVESDLATYAINTLPVMTDGSNKWLLVYTGNSSTIKLSKGDSFSRPAIIANSLGRGRVGSSYVLDLEYPTITDLDVNILAPGAIRVTWDWDGGSPAGNDSSITFDGYYIYTSEVNQATADAMRANGDPADTTIEMRTTEQWDTTVTIGNTLFVSFFPADIYGNAPDAGTYSEDSRTAPVVQSVSAEQTDESNGYVTITVTVFDGNGDDIKLGVFYNTDGLSTGTACSLVGSEVVSVTPSQATMPGICNDDTYQVGTTDGIENDGVGNTVVIFRWDSQTDVGIVNDTYYIGITPQDTASKTGSTLVSSGFTLDSRPIAPNAPTVGNFADTSFDVTQSATASETTLEYAIHVEGASDDGWVQSDGTVGVTEYYNTIAAKWNPMSVTGLTKETLYSLYSTSRYSSVLSLKSDNSDITEATTPSATPVVSAVSITVTTPTDGSKIYDINYDLTDDDTAVVSVSMEYYDGSSYFPIVSATGDIDSVSGVSGTTDTYTVSWNAGNDADRLDVSASKIRVTINDFTQTAVFTQVSTFYLDTADPAFASNTVLSYSAILATQVGITWSNTIIGTETHFADYEIFYSILSQEDANNRVESSTNFKWDDTDDAAMALETNVTTIITGLTSNTTYYFSLFAIDSYGNVSNIVAGTEKTLREYLIEGYAKDAFGNDVPSADVYLIIKSTGGLKSSTTSNSSGYYSFTVTSDFEYQVVIRKDSYTAGIEGSIFGVAQ